MPGIIRWSEPPSDLTNGPREKIDHARIAWQLKSRPGESALVYIGDRSLVPMITKARLSFYRPGGSFEAVASWIGGQYYTWAWYVGKDLDN